MLWVSVCVCVCVCVCVSCSDSQQDSLITEESKHCIFLIQRKKYKMMMLIFLVHTSKKGLWVKKQQQQWKRLDHYCLWGHDNKGMVLLFYVKKKQKNKRKREREASSSCGKLWNSTTSSVSDAFQSTSGNLLTDIYYPKPHHPRPQKETLCLVHKGTMVWERFAFSTWSFLSKPP